MGGTGLGPQDVRTRQPAPGGRDGLVVLRELRLARALFVMDLGQPQPRPEVVGLAAQGVAEVGDGGFGVAEGVVGHGAAPVRPEVAGVGGDGVAEGGDGGGVLARPAVDLGAFADDDGRVLGEFGGAGEVG